MKGDAMKKLLIFILSFLAQWFAGAAYADTSQMIREYSNHHMADQPGSTILLKGNPQQINTFSKWLDQIVEVPKGLHSLKKIANSGHQLTIQHSTHALLSAGRTVAPMSLDLINGKGASVQILFNADIPDHGSHMVRDGKRQLIEYTAVQNLYHELAHAMHMMNGTWRYFKSEQQAIEEENIFRKELALIQGKTPVYRFFKTGVLISDVANTINISERVDQTLLKGHSSKILPNSASSAGIKLPNR
jgi:ABC-type uncharacterized transport system YnjBCD substrate-binding protein